MERVILTTGGTGGHIFPALAVAEEIRSRNPRAMILFMGGKYGQEADLAVNAGLDFVGLPVRGVMGRGVKGIVSAFSISRGLAKALAVIAKVKPEVVVGFGGYAAFAGVLAGRMAGKITAIHEQNAFPGMANRLLGKVVDRVFLSLADISGTFAQEKTEIVGNPVRSDIVDLYEKARVGQDETGKKTAHGCEEAQIKHSDPDVSEGIPRSPRLLVMGGSLGARAINDGLMASIHPLLEAGIELWHQTGQADYERVRSAYRTAGANSVRVEPFIANVAKALAWTDLILCRAGASSIAEITAAGLPAILTPFPHAAQDHQRHNARFLVQAGGAVLLEQKDFLHEPGALVDQITGLLRDRPRLTEMAARSLAVAKPYAARHLVDELESLLAATDR